MTDIIIVRYGELALKSTGVRNWYERKLVQNIAAMLKFRGIGPSQIKREWGRIFVHTTDSEAAGVVANVFGVVSTSPAISSNATLADVAKVCADIGAGMIHDGESFAIRTRRTGNHSFSSRDIGIKCGDAVWERLVSIGQSPSVNLTDPDKEIFVEMRQTRAYIYTTKSKGVGGFPLGTQGKMIALVSGGIDSPVSAWLMMKRGVEIIPVYCNNEPFSDETTRERAMDCIKVLADWAPGHPMKVYEVPHGDNLTAFLTDCEYKNTCLLCRRTMYREAFEIMKKEGSSGIITGASLGQVASQTSANMYAEVYGLGIPLYHPLIGHDKTEIIDIANRIGTFNSSIKPATCCTAVPDFPEVKAKVDALALEEKKVDIDDLVSYSVSNAKVIIIDSLSSISDQNNDGK
ncbi:MAG: tRNA 4-thiouridine(8) synthase ThiI [Methanosarcinaceae archaeon]|nr:tRNA 4-thiouridine(8) synthase ThiI [Methanosarcinaceae archaeon]